MSATTSSTVAPGRSDSCVLRLLAAGVFGFVFGRAWGRAVCLPRELGGGGGGIVGAL
jgi:hypothetical protein